MVAVSLGQRDQAAAIEIDAVVVNEIGILVRILAAGVKPNLALVFIDSIDSPHHVRSRW